MFNPDEFSQVNCLNLVKALIVSYKFIQKADKAKNAGDKLLIQFEKFFNDENSSGINDLIWQSIPVAINKDGFTNPDKLLGIISLYYDDVITINQCIIDLNDYLQFGTLKVYK